MKHFFWINLGAFAVYTLLYFVISDEFSEGFPITWAVYFSVHGLGLWILSIVQRSIRNTKLSSQCLSSGALILCGGWLVAAVGFMI